MSNPKVTSRLDLLRAEHAERHAVTVDTITTELEEARLMAMKKDVQQASAAVNASMSKAKLHGLVVDKKEVEGNLKVRTIADFYGGSDT
jgi:hypothetical protein